MRTLKIRLIELTHTLKNRPLMVISDFSFESLKFYLQGYFDGLVIDGKSMNAEISSWLRKRESSNFAVNWTQYVLHMASGNHEEAKEILIKLLEEYIEDNDEWLQSINHN